MYVVVEGRGRREQRDQGDWKSNQAHRILGSWG